MAIRVRGTTILISRVRLQFESTLIRLLAIDRKSSQPTTSLDSSCPATSRSFELWEAELEIESERGGPTALGRDALFGMLKGGDSACGVKLRMRSSEAFDADEALPQGVPV